MKFISFLIVAINIYIVFTFTVSEIFDCMNFECNLLIEACTNNRTCAN